jgi:hypothetical protein
MTLRSALAEAGRLDDYQISAQINTQDLATKLGAGGH